MQSPQTVIAGSSSRGTALCRHGGSRGFASACNSLALFMGSPNQKIGGDAELARTRRIIATVSDRFRVITSETRARLADDRFEILSRQPLLLHPEPDSSNRIRSVNDVMLRFVGVYQSGQNTSSSPAGVSGAAPMSSPIRQSLPRDLPQSESMNWAYRCFSIGHSVTSILSFPCGCRANNQQYLVG